MKNQSRRQIPVSKISIAALSNVLPFNAKLGGLDLDLLLGQAVYNDLPTRIGQVSFFCNLPMQRGLAGQGLLRSKTFHRFRDLRW